MDVVMKCSLCRFWEPPSGGRNRDFGTGVCRRFPPRVFKPQKSPKETKKNGSSNEDWFWPVTVGIDWCGEFQRIEE